MPSRGAPWKVGGINDEHIVEADLDSALQAKVNSGGGAWEQVSTDTFGGSSTFDKTGLNISLSSISQLLIIFTGQIAVADVVTVFLNGDNTGGAWDMLGTTALSTSGIFLYDEAGVNA
ncbi:MAG: hypothetical protein V3V41_06525, partial [Candidatus Heimdallarchaeota archaeon]